MSRARLDPCASCKGFVPPRAEVCPHCRTTQARKAGLFARLHLSALGGAVGGGAIAMTLMACYGGPPVDCEDYGGCFDPDARSLADAQVGDAARSDAASDAARDGAVSDARTDGGADPDAGDAEPDAGP